MGVLELHDTSLHPQEGLTLTPGLDIKHIYKAGRCCCRAGATEAVRRVGGGSSHPSPGSSWHRAHLKAKSSGRLHNLVRRQLLLVCFVMKLAMSLSWSSTPVLGAV